MILSKHELERMRAELQRVLGEHSIGIGSLPAGGVAAATLLRVLETLPDGTGMQGVIRALAEEERRDGLVGPAHRPETHAV